MKNQNKTIGLLLLAGMATFLFWLIVGTKFSSGRKMDINDPAGNPRSFNSASTNAPPPVNEADEGEAWLKDRVKRTEAWAESKNVRIDFWGRVVDEDNQPLEGVEVVATTRQWIFPFALTPASRFTTNRTVTGFEGNFSFLDLRGDSLVFQDLRKDGYELERQSLGFGYATSEQYRSDPSRPVVYRMWKRRGAEPMIYRQRNHRIPYDGTPLFIDMFAGQVGTNAMKQADLRVSLVRDPRQIKWGTRERYDWKATIEAPHGQVRSSDDPFMYWAPEDGYAPRLEIDSPRDSPSWTQDKSVSFYLKTRGGKYARVTLEFRTGSDQETTGFTYAYYLNPSGSRNLEYDGSRTVPLPAP